MVEDQIKLAASWDKVSQESVASYIDSSLCLSSKQQRQVAELLAENWDNSWNQMAASLQLNGFAIGRQMIASMDEVKLKLILTDEQNEVFKNLENMAVGSIFMLAGPPGFEEETEKPDIKKICNTLMDLKIAEYMKLCDLDEKQLKVLSVARKGAIGKVASRYADQIADLQDNPNGVGLNNFRTMIEFSKPLLVKCTSEPAWQKTLRKVLTEDQLKKIEARELERADAVREQSCQFMAHAFVSEQLQLKLSLERHDQLVALIRKQCEKDGTRDLYSCLFSMFKVSDEEFQSVFTDEEWTQFSPMFEQQRQQMEQMMGDPEEDEDSTDE